MAMKLLSFGMVLLSIALLGCGQVQDHTSSATAEVAAPIEPWRQQLAKLQAAVKPNMTQDEVTKAAGEPNRVKTSMGSAVTTEIWEYDLGAGEHFSVRFSKEGRVSVAELFRAVKPQ